LERVFLFLTFLKNIFKNNLCETLFASDNLFDRIALPGTADSLCRAPASGALDLPRWCTMVTVFVVAAPHALARQLTRQPCGRGSGRWISLQYFLESCARSCRAAPHCVVWHCGACMVGASRSLAADTLFVWLIRHQPAVLFSQNKPAISTFLSEQISTSHQPNEQVGVQQTSSCLAL
jgi:hypothetical protein